MNNNNLFLDKKKVSISDHFVKTPTCFLPGKILRVDALISYCFLSNAT